MPNDVDNLFARACPTCGRDKNIGTHGAISDVTNGSLTITCKVPRDAPSLLWHDIELVEPEAAPEYWYKPTP